MAKDLHWFKFNISEYMAGDIIFCSDAAQGVFARLCCLYWARECNLTRSQALKHLPGREAILDELIKDEVIKVDGEALRIHFLDEQKATWYELSAVKSEAGKLGGRGNKKADRKARDKANVKQTEKQNESTPESKSKAEHKAKQSYREGDKTSMPEKAGGSRYPDGSSRQPSTPSNPAGSGFGVPSSNQKTIKLRADFMDDIEGYKFKQSEVTEILEEFDRVEDKHIEAGYLQFRRKWRTEEGKKKTPKAKELIDLFYTYAEILDDDNT